jgi:hypothetical protein
MLSIKSFSLLLLAAICAGSIIGCDSNAGSGALIGGGAGAALGALAGGPRHALGGAVLGGAVGAAGGAIVGNQIDREQARRERYYEYADGRAVVVDPYYDREVIVEHSPWYDGPPPPPPVETFGARPYPDSVWISGYWIRHRHYWVWHHGYWR